MRTTPLIAAALALTLAPTAWAQRHSDRYSDRDYPDRRYMQRVEALAGEVEQTAYWLRRTFERNNRRPDYAEERVLRQLRELNEDAHRFSREVESYRQDPRETRQDFRELVRTYRQTWDVLDDTGRRSYLDRGMASIGEDLRELSRHYGGGWDRRWDRRWDDDDRDGRWRDRDGRYDDDGRPRRR